MPITPSCQPSPQTTYARRLRFSAGHASTTATASRRIRSSTACRSRLSVSSSLARMSASRSSFVSTRCRPTSGRPSRPAALSRGARRNATAVASTVAGSTPATRISARSPGFWVRERPRRPVGGERAVLVDERDDVGDRGERDEVGVAGDRGMVGAEERLRQLGDDAGAAEVGKRVVGRPRGDDRAVAAASRPAGGGR